MLPFIVALFKQSNVGHNAHQRHHPTRSQGMCPGHQHVRNNLRICDRGKLRRPLYSSGVQQPARIPATPEQPTAHVPGRRLVRQQERAASLHPDRGVRRTVNPQRFLPTQRV